MSSRLRGQLPVAGRQRRYPLDRIPTTSAPPDRGVTDGPSVAARPGSPTPPAFSVARLTVDQVVRRVSHLVQQGVQSLTPVAFQHEIQVEGDLQDHAPAVQRSRHHLAETGGHATRETQGNAGRE